MDVFDISRYETFQITADTYLFLFTVFIASCKKKEETEPIKFYKVGEGYQVGAEEGIVYKVVTLDGGMYAMAVSLDEVELPWSSEMLRQMQMIWKMV